MSLVDPGSVCEAFKISVDGGGGSITTEVGEFDDLHGAGIEIEHTRCREIDMDVYLRLAGGHRISAGDDVNQAINIDVAVREGACKGHPSVGDQRISQV